MGRKQEIGTEKRAVIVALHHEGYSSRTIATKVGVAQSTVVYTLQRFKQTGANASVLRSGRPRVTSYREDQFICVQSKRQRTRTAPEIREEVNNMRAAPISVSTVQRRLREQGLKGCIAAKKTFITDTK